MRRSFLKTNHSRVENISENTLWSVSFTFLHAECEKSIFRQKWALELTGHGLQGFSVFSNSWHVSSWFVPRWCGKVSIEINSSYGPQSKGGHFYLAESYRNISSTLKSRGIVAPAHLLLLQLLRELHKEHGWSDALASSCQKSHRGDSINCSALSVWENELSC